MATILITGGCGFIGSNFARYWLDEHPDDRLVNYDLLTYAGNPANLAAFQGDSRYSFVRGDIADADAVAAALEEHRPDFVVNFAAESHNSRALRDPGLFLRTNALGTQTLLESARSFGVRRFHHVSTCEVFGELALDSPAKFSEDSPLLPRTPYSSSKAAGDLSVRAYVESFGLPATVSMCANNYGPQQHPEKLIPHFATRLLLGKKLPLYRSSMHRREWLHVSDHCRALDVILAKGAPGARYNIGNEFEESIEGIADRMLAAFGLDSSWKEYVQDRPGHDQRYLLDSSRLSTELGWQPQVQFDEGFAATVDWYRSNEDWWRPLVGKLAVDETSWGGAQEGKHA